MNNLQSSTPATDCGQAAILMVLVVLGGLIALGGMAVFAQAVVHRARSQSAADAIALATAVDPDQGSGLSGWYLGQGIEAQPAGDRVTVQSGPSQAGSRAEQSLSDVSVAPALVAIVARAEQLVGLPIEPLRWDETSVELAQVDADRLSLVANELGLCALTSEANSATVHFELC